MRWRARFPEAPPAHDRFPEYLATVPARHAASLLARSMGQLNLLPALRVDGDRVLLTRGDVAALWAVLTTGPGGGPELPAARSVICTRSFDGFTLGVREAMDFAAVLAEVAKVRALLTQTRQGFARA